MLKIIKSSLFKLSKDWTFRITLIIGAALALFLNLLYLGIDLAMPDASGMKVATGQNGLISALSPTQNFGLTVPINLIIFTIGEFSCGTIRNKIIAGNKKVNIYLGLLITGLIFSLSLMLVFVLLSFGVGSIMGGFDPTGMTTYGMLGEGFLWKYIVQAIFVYIFIVSIAIFFSTLTRNIGATMPIVIILIMFTFFWALIAKTIAMLDETSTVTNDFSMWFNPLYVFGSFTVNNGNVIEMNDQTFIASIVTPTYWSALFIFFGTLIFSKRDVK